MWCKVVLLQSIASHKKETVLFIDEADSAPNGRKNCFLASIARVFELDIDWREYRARRTSELARDILEFFVKK